MKNCQDLILNFYTFIHVKIIWQVSSSECSAAVQAGLGGCRVCRLTIVYPDLLFSPQEGCSTALNGLFVSHNSISQRKNKMISIERRSDLPLAILKMVPL